MELLNRGRFADGIFPEGLVLSRDCPNPLKWHKNLSLSLPSSAVKILLRFLAFERHQIHLKPTGSAGLLVFRTDSKHIEYI